MPDNPNPQGKAALPLLQDLQALRRAPTPRRSARDVLVDYLSGLLVLSARFNLRPVPGQAYHLYYRGGEWQLSLIAPDEWHPPRRDCYAARCVLAADASWSIEPDEGLAARRDIVSALRQFQADFEARLAQVPTLADDLPHYEATLPYYRRVMAAGLASSLRRSLQQLGLEQVSGAQLLPEASRLLPGSG